MESQSSRYGKVSPVVVQGQGEGTDAAKLSRPAANRRSGCGCSAERRTRQSTTLKIITIILRRHAKYPFGVLENMASLRAPSASFLSAFLPIARASLLPQQAVRRMPLLHQIQQRLNASLLPAALVPIPALLGELWDGLLKAVPKKKTSHMKKRHRQMAGKALKDVTALNKCSACGRVKRAHILCPHCVLSM